MIAALGMYDLPPLQAANDRLWAAIRDGLRARGVTAPETLTRGEAAYWAAWEDPGLVFAQTCGFPYRARLHGRVTLVGTPDYGVDGCPPGHYRSILVARADDPRQTLAGFDGATLAFNEPLSQSGWAAPMNHARASGIRFVTGPETGGHRLSAIAVAEGRADIAALDAVTWSLLQAHDPVAARLKPVGETDPTPVLPFIAGKGADADKAFAAAADAIAALSDADRNLLRLRGIVAIPAAAYLAVPTPEPPVPGAFQP
jgi:ABC-type phosphate/phosphonate transport system substrate-binding protein